MTKEIDSWEKGGDRAIGNPAAISFSDDTDTGGDVDHPHTVDAAKYFEEEEEGVETFEDELMEPPAQAVASKPPFFRRPIFYLVLVVALVLVGSLILSLSKQKKRKAVTFGDSQQFSQQAPPVTPLVLPENQPQSQFSNPAPSTTDAPGQAATAPAPVVAPPVTTGPALSQPATTISGDARLVNQSQQPAKAAASTPSTSGDVVNLENRMKEEMLSLAEKNLALQREIRQLSVRVDRISKVSPVAAASSKKVTEAAVEPAAVKPQINPLTSFIIKAINGKGQAWISTPAGTYTVNVGDMLPGNIRVTGIDPDNLEVVTSAGVLRYKK